MIAWIYFQLLMKYGLFHLKSYWRGCLRPFKKITAGWSTKKSDIPAGWYQCRTTCILQGGQFFPIQPHFVGFIVVNVRKSHCRVPWKGWNCRVGGGPTCFAEIAAGWSELFFDIAEGWSKKLSADTPPSNFLNGIALSRITFQNESYRFPPVKRFFFLNIIWEYPGESRNFSCMLTSINSSLCLTQALRNVHSADKSL